MFLCFVIVFFIYISFSESKVNNNVESSSGEEVVLAFITYNDFGNNLYIDNLTSGRRVTNDVKVSSVNNIKPGITYLPDNSPDTIAPKLNITNLGLIATPTDSANAVTVFLRVFNFDYWDSVKVTTAIAPGATYEVIFDNLVIFPGTEFLLHAYIRYPADPIRNNDTLFQFSSYLPGIKRKVLFQEFTSATSPSSASNNIFLNAFLASNSDNVTSIKYHRGVPPPGTDSMYLANPVQSDSMRLYYNTFQVPSTIVDGKHLLQIPYSLDSNLIKPFNARINEGSPVLVQVSDSLLASGDTIMSTVTVNNVYNLSAEGSYTLKLNVIEKYKAFSPMPSGWYDSIFIDIFRTAVPGIYGIPLPTAQGQYIYQFKFYIQPGWNYSKIYTVAFVQNEANREILNSAKSKNIPIPLITKPIVYKPINPRNIDFEPPLSFKNVFTPENLTDTVYLYPTQFTAQNFESYFPPPGWRIKNPDALITFDRYTGSNGPQLGGNNSVRMPFYFYSYEGQRDTLVSAKIYGLKNTDTIKFDYSYAQYSSQTIDSLKVLISNDGGKTYFPEPVFNKGGLSLATSGSTTIAYAPTNPNQWKTFSIGLADVVNINQISSQIPSSFNLHQNYPNPFNPATKIKFDINKTGFVKLKIYDITGRESASLVNVKLNPGQYEYKWNATNFASGVYFYTLKLEDASVSKRMVLVK
jgi:hypothetical protein